MKLTREEKITLKTYNDNALDWLGGHPAIKIYKEEMKIFKKFLPTGKILEIGSGSGRDAKELIDLGYSYVGTDISKSLLSIAKKANPGAKFLLQSVYDLDFPDNMKFDGFWASAVLLHIPKTKIDVVLQKIHKFIKSGGIGFISFKEGQGERLENNTSDYKGSRFFAYYLREEFEGVLLRNNFEIIQFKKVNKSNTNWLYFFVRVLK